MKAMVNIPRRLVSVITTAAIAVCCIFVSFVSTASADKSDADYKDMAFRMGVLVNEYRAKNGLKPLYMIPYLNDKAYERAREIMYNLSHTRPGGDKYSTIIDYNLIHCTKTGENIAAGYESPEVTLEQWIESSIHNKLLLSPEFTHMGIGVSYEPNSEYGWYWDNLFITMNEEFGGQYIPLRNDVIPASEGDISGDSSINSFDYLMVCKYYLSKSDNLNALQIVNADVMQDGEINVCDMLAMRSYILGMVESLPITQEEYSALLEARRANQVTAAPDEEETTAPDEQETAVAEETEITTEAESEPGHGSVTPEEALTEQGEVPAPEFPETNTEA